MPFARPATTSSAGDGSSLSQRLRLGGMEPQPAIESRARTYTSVPPRRILSSRAPKRKADRSHDSRSLAPSPQDSAVADIDGAPARVRDPRQRKATARIGAVPVAVLRARRVAAIAGVLAGGAASAPARRIRPSHPQIVAQAEAGRPRVTRIYATRLVRAFAASSRRYRSAPAALSPAP